MTYLHVLDMFDGFCFLIYTMKGTKRYMKILFILLPNRFTFGGKQTILYPKMVRRQSLNLSFTQ